LIVMSEINEDGASADDDTQVDEVEVKGQPGALRAEVPSAFEALAVRKKRHASNKGRITFGRERTCDIVVRTPGVSKSHACFLPGLPLRLQDLGSQNGTFVDGDRLMPEQPVEVRPGSMVTFGDLPCKLIMPDELYALLKTPRS